MGGSVSYNQRFLKSFSLAAMLKQAKGLTERAIKFLYFSALFTIAAYLADMQIAQKP